MPGRNIISIPIRPISNAEILKKYIFSLRKITASIVTNKGTIKCIAVNFSNGTIGVDYPAPPQVAIQPFKIKRQPISHQLNKIDFIVKLINKFIQTKRNTL